MDCKFDLYKACSIPELASHHVFLQGSSAIAPKSGAIRNNSVLYTQTSLSVVLVKRTTVSAVRCLCSVFVLRTCQSQTSIAWTVVIFSQSASALCEKNNGLNMCLHYDLSTDFPDVHYYLRTHFRRSFYSSDQTLF